MCPPVIWSHIFHRHRNIPLFRSISLVDTKKKSATRDPKQFHIEPDLNKIIYQYADIPIPAYYYNCRCVNIYEPQICIGSMCNHFCLFKICYKNVYAYVILCRLNTSSGGSRGGGGGFQKNVVKKCVLSIFIYNIALQNTDFGVLQKSSKHFLISIFFPPGQGGHPLPVPPRSLLRVSNNEYLFVHNFLVKNIFCQYLYTIVLQNMDLCVL